MNEETPDQYDMWPSKETHESVGIHMTDFNFRCERIARFRKKGVGDMVISLKFIFFPSLIEEVMMDMSIVKQIQTPQESRLSIRKKGQGTNFIYFVGGDYDGDRKMDDLKFFYRAYIADALSGGRIEKDKDLCAKVQIFLENSSSLWEMMRLILQ
ncbi:protein TIC110, chloroplastic [Tanacetum coccineum]